MKLIAQVLWNYTRQRVGRTVRSVQENRFERAALLVSRSRKIDSTLDLTNNIRDSTRMKSQVTS